MVAEKNPKKDGFEMFGDFCREAGVLVLVFAFLDKVMQRDGSVNLTNLIYVVIVSFGFLLAGIAFEKWRKL